jgi:hypothetical protein
MGSSPPGHLTGVSPSTPNTRAEVLFLLHLADRGLATLVAPRECACQACQHTNYAAVQ